MKHREKEKVGTYIKGAIAPDEVEARSGGKQREEQKKAEWPDRCVGCAAR
jgi:hypothetical protein